MPDAPVEGATNRGRLSGNEPAAVAQVLVKSFPRDEAKARARNVLAELNRALPRHDWESLLDAALRERFGAKAEGWKPGIQLGVAAKSKRAATARMPRIVDGSGEPAPEGAAAAAGATAPAPKALRISAAKSPPKPPVKVGPSKSVATLSGDLERILAQEQMAQKAPPGMEKCPLCGAILQPTRNKRIRMHDNPVKGTRCEASKELKAQFEGGAKA